MSATSKEASAPRLVKGKLFAPSTFKAPMEALHSSNSAAIWVDAGELLFKGALGSLKYFLVDKWKVSPIQAPSLEDLEEWVVPVWRLKGEVMIVPLNEESLLFEFSTHEEAKGVLENGRRWYKEEMLGLECGTLGQHV